MIYCRFGGAQGHSMKMEQILNFEECRKSPFDGLQNHK